LFWLVGDGLFLFGRAAANGKALSRRAPLGLPLRPVQFQNTKTFRKKYGTYFFLTTRHRKLTQNSQKTLKTHITLTENSEPGFLFCRAVFFRRIVAATVRKCLELPRLVA